MAKRPPNYLKLHTHESEPRPEPAACPPQVAEVCRAFTEATGWPLRYVPHPEPSQDVDLLWSAPVNPGAGTAPGHLRIDLGGQGTATARPIELEQAQLMAEGLVSIIGQLLRLEHALREREAELAAGIPVVARSADGRHLADTLEALLKAAASSVDGVSAALYLLDDATTELKLRASYGLPVEQLIEAGRPLQGAIADLEALLGHAVTLENNSLFDYWRVPQPCSAAVCVPVSSASMPLGTLWIFCDRATQFGDSEINLVEIIAGRIASDLEREVLVGETMAARDLKGQIEAAHHLQQSQLPRISPLVDGWDVAGWTCQGDKIGGSFHDWFVMADGSLAVAVGDALEGGLDAGLSASGLRTALRAHAEYPHQPEGLVNRVNATLWTASAGDQFASLFYAVIDQRTGEIRYTTAGRPKAWLIAREGLQSLAHGSWPLGVQPEPNYERCTAQITPGGVLLVSSGLCTPKQDRAKEEWLDAIVGKLSLAGRPETSEQMLELTRTCLWPSGSKEDRTLLIVKRL